MATQLHSARVKDQSLCMNLDYTFIYLNSLIFYIYFQNSEYLSLGF